MHINNHKYYKNFKHFILRGLFSIPLMITMITYIRFIYLYYIKKNFKSFYPLDNEVVKRNTGYINLNILNPLAINNFFSHKKKLHHFQPLKSLYFLNRLNMKVLCIGPRTETELFSLVALGFQLKNINALDLHSYSDLIKLGDATDIPFDTNTFDLVIIGKMLVYTDEPDKVINETVRILKNNGIVSMYHSHVKNENFSKFRLDSSKKIFDLFGNNLDYVYFKYHTFDKQTDSNRGSSNIVVSIKK